MTLNKASAQNAKAKIVTGARNAFLKFSSGAAANIHSAENTAQTNASIKLSAS